MSSKSLRTVPAVHVRVESYERMCGAVAQVRNAVRLVVHPIAKSIRQYLASSHLMAAVERRQRSINVARMRRKK